MKFQEVEKVYNKYLYLEEPDYLKIVFATVLANRLDTVPVWLMVIGNSSTGKSEILSSLESSPEILSVSLFTQNSLLSGHQQEDGLIARLDKRVMIVKDASTIATIHSNQRSFIFSQLRAAYDGQLEKATGLGQKTLRAKFGMIIAGTPAVEHMRTFEVALGERFIYYRPKLVTTDSIWEKVKVRAQEWSKAKAHMTMTASSFLEGFKMPMDIFTFDGLEFLAECIPSLRAEVMRDGYTKEINFVVDVYEAPIRVFKQLVALYTALLYLCSEPEAQSIIKRICRDAIPFIRLRVFEAINAGLNTPSHLITATGMSKSSLLRTLEDMTKLKLLDKTVSEKNTFYNVAGKFKPLFRVRPLFGNG